MGRISHDHDPSSAHRSSHPPSVHHFSHPHPLELTSFDLSLSPPACSCCTLRFSGVAAYSCKPCGYVLHVDCAKLPQVIRHPADTVHPLTLLPVPAYPEGLFKCDACGHDGTGFSFHCVECSLDVHALCASKPLTVRHQAHLHPLSLAFSPPYENKGFSCDLCGGIGSNHWLYRCATCNFDAHLGCATAHPAQPQQQPMSPQAMGLHPMGLGHSRSWHGPGAATGRAAFGVPPGFYRAASTGPGGWYGGAPVMAMPGSPNRPVNAGGSAGSLLNTLANEFVQGAVQQMEQNAIQSIIGGGAGSGGNILESALSGAVSGVLNGSGFLN